MKQLYYFSRNFVEFGTFTAEEIIDFAKRGILTDHDYVRCVETETWETIGQWLPTTPDAKPAAKPAAKTKTASTRKKAAPTKASKKAA